MHLSNSFTALSCTRAYTPDSSLSPLFSTLDQGQWFVKGPDLTIFAERSVGVDVEGLDPFVKE
jgi:hypothetical protein